MTFDQWMNICGITGVGTYLLAWWWMIRGVTKEILWINRAMRFIGLGLILTPLFLRWYLTESMILTASLLLAGVGGVILLNARKSL